VVVFLPLDPRFAGSNLAEDDGFLRVIKIHSTTSFGGEVKLSVPCRRFMACKRTLWAWKRCFVSKSQWPCFSPMSLLLRYLMALMILADESGLSRNCAEAAGLPPTTLSHKKGLNMTSWLDSCLGMDQLAQALKLLMVVTFSSQITKQYDF
jgi:hypothetical protein